MLPIRQEVRTRYPSGIMILLAGRTSNVTSKFLGRFLKKLAYQRLLRDLLKIKIVICIRHRGLKFILFFKSSLDLICAITATIPPILRIIFRRMELTLSAPVLPILLTQILIFLKSHDGRWLKGSLVARSKITCEPGR